MGLLWFLADLKSGDVIDELPLRASNIERAVSSKKTCQVSLDVADNSCPPNWSDLIDGTRAMIVPVYDDVPLAGFIIDGAEPGGETVGFTLATLESCLDYWFCGTYDFYEGTDDEATALATLLLDGFADSFGFVVDVTPTGRTADHSYSEYEDRTLASAAQEMASAKGGPEWTTRIRWADGTHRRFVKTIEIGPQVGRLIPSTLFENQHTTGRVRRRSWTNRAVDVRATGDGAGESRPMSPAVVDQAALDAGVPRWQARVAAPTVSDDDLTLVAEQSLINRRYGTGMWETTLVAVEAGAPSVGADFDAGDTVTVAFDRTRWDPATWHGTARVVGWRADIAGRTLTKVTPVFWNPDEEDR